MANWNYGGYTAPSSVTSKDDVRNIQRQLGVTADGLWGPKTQAAYEASGMANQNQAAAPFNYTTTDLDALQAQIYSKLSAPSISYSMPSQQELAAQISAYLRPSYDNAIAQRRDQTLYNRAQIDADAASRGMGRSTYVTDVKDQAMDAEASDIASLESDYKSALLQAVQDQYNQHLQNKLAADQYNSQAQYAAQEAAWQSALGLYGNNLAQAQAASSRGGGGSSGTRTQEPEEIEMTAIERKAAELVTGAQGNKSTAAARAKSYASNAGSAAEKTMWNDVLRVLGG